MERWLGRRRSKRLHLQVRVRVLGHHRGKGSFKEDTSTLNVSVNGSLVTLAQPVELGQTVVVRNHVTGEDQECRVAFVGPVTAGKAKVGLGFTHPAPHFWNVDFPRLDPTREAASAAAAGRIASPARR